MPARPRTDKRAEYAVRHHVIAGLDPAIHPASRREMDARVKPAHDVMRWRIEVLILARDPRFGSPDAVLSAILFGTERERGAQLLDRRA